MTKKKKTTKGPTRQATLEDVALSDEVDGQKESEVDTSRQVDQSISDDVDKLDDHVATDVARTPQRTGASSSSPQQARDHEGAHPSPVVEVERRPEQTRPPSPAVEAPPSEGTKDFEQPNASNQQKTWANLFKDNRKIKQAVSLDQYKAKNQRLVFEYDDIDEMEDTMGFCLVGCFMGQHPGRDGIKWIANRWKVPYKFFMHKSGWIVYRFETKQDMDNVLQGGPYFAYGIPIFLKIMPRCFLFDEDCRFVPAWVQIFGLPPDCWSQKVLSMVGSEIGKPLYTDMLTRTRERLEYARLMVEVPVFGERVLEVPIALPTGAHINLKIVYEMLPDFCDICKKMGHKKGDCNKGNERAGQQTKPRNDRPNEQNGRQRSKSAWGRGRSRRRTHTRQQWRPRQQEENQQNVPNEEDMHHQKEPVCMDLVLHSPIPIAVDPPIEVNMQNGTSVGSDENTKEDSLNAQNSRTQGGVAYTTQGESSGQGATKGWQTTRRQTRARAARGGGQ